MENPIKMDDLGIPLFLETPIFFLLRWGQDPNCQQDLLPSPSSTRSPRFWPDRLTEENRAHNPKGLKNHQDMKKTRDHFWYTKKCKIMEITYNVTPLLFHDFPSKKANSVILCQKTCIHVYIYYISFQNEGHFPNLISRKIPCRLDS